jgi:hypothetical protein
MLHVESDVYAATAITWRWYLMMRERQNRKCMHNEAMEQKEVKWQVA